MATYRIGMMQTKNTYRSGFTLIEMAMVLAILSLILGGALSITAKTIEERKITVTNKRMEYIMQTIKQYVEEFNQIPCPAGGNEPHDSTGTNFGIGVGTGDNATSNHNCSEADKTVSIGDVIAGSVPTGSLGIEPIYALDGWNRRITYVVDEDLTFSTSEQDGGDGDDVGPAALSASPWTEEGWNNALVTQGDIEIKDENGNYIASRIATATDVTDQTYDCAATQVAVTTAGVDCIPLKAAVLLISHGTNGHSAWKLKGGIQLSDSRATTARTMEDDNGHFDTAMDRDFRTMSRRDVEGSPNTTLGNQIFDDIMMYWTKWQLEQ